MASCARGFLSTAAERLPSHFVQLPLPSILSVASCFRSEEHTSELQSLMRISYAVFCLKKKNKHNNGTRKQSKTHNNKIKNTHISEQTQYIHRSSDRTTAGMY